MDAISHLNAGFYLNCFCRLLSQRYYGNMYGVLAMPLLQHMPYLFIVLRLSQRILKRLTRHILTHIYIIFVLPCVLLLSQHELIILFMKHFWPDHSNPPLLDNIYVLLGCYIRSSVCPNLWLTTGFLTLSSKATKELKVIWSYKSCP